MIRCANSLHIAVLVSALLLLTACASKSRWDQTPRDQHIVRSGETLFSIGWRYGKDPADLVKWNDIGDGSLIYPGQVIRLTPPSAQAAATSSSKKPASKSRKQALPADPSPNWRWPVPGGVATEFGSRPGSGTGLLLAGTVGDPVRAAAAGRVVYAGSGLIGYGKLIILKHNDTYLSAYGYNKSLLAAEGQAIKKGQRIATLGEGPGREPRLHFEIRQNGEPVNPRQYLPAR
jgi:lipoprotein NlpD